MDGKTTSSESWTDEKHLRYLNSIEASFVRTMLENNDLLPLRLHRYLPDTSDSTLGSKPHRATTLINYSERTASRGRLVGSRAAKRSRRFVTSSRPLNSSPEDQVVPQMEITAVGEKDEKDQLNVPMAPVNARS